MIRRPPSSNRTDTPVPYPTLFRSCVVVLQLSIGLLAALLLNKAVFGRGLVRSIAILPWVIPGIIIALMFQQMFSGSRLGIMNTVIEAFGLPSRSWFSDPVEAMAIMIFAVVWRGDRNSKRLNSSQ